MCVGMRACVGVTGGTPKRVERRVRTLRGLGLSDWPWASGSPHRGRQEAGRDPAHVRSLFQGMSETFETLHNLVHKGVKVVMDIPYELWNETSAEVADLKKQVGPRGGDGSAAPPAGRPPVRVPCGAAARKGPGAGPCRREGCGSSATCWWRSSRR